MTERDVFINNPPCVLAPKGFAADSLLYMMVKTYLLAIPVISNGKGGNQSTFHQDHVESIHAEAFKQQRSYINSYLNGSVKAPDFIRR